jgi:hypothetical protein
MTSLDKLAAEPRIVVRHEAPIDPRGRYVVYRMRRTHPPNLGDGGRQGRDCV